MVTKHVHGRHIVRYVLSIFFIIITVTLVLIALVPMNNSDKEVSMITGPKIVSQADTSLSMVPSEITVDQNTGALDVIIDTGKNTVSLVQLEIGYDPAVLQNVTISQGSFFTNTRMLLNENNTRTGRISYAISVQNDATAKNGRGIVARIRFEKNPSSMVNETNISLLEKSLVTQPGVDMSTIKKRSGAKILFPYTTTPSPASITITPVP